VVHQKGMACFRRPEGQEKQEQHTGAPEAICCF